MYFIEKVFHTITSGNFTIFFLILLLFFIANWYFSVPKNLPPGPFGLPIVGSLLLMGKRPDKTITKLGKIYGSIFSMYLGSQLTVILNDYNAIKEAFVKQAETFAGRPVSGFLSISEPNKLGMATADGIFWKDHRRFTLTLLRDCGVGKLSIEPRIIEEINYFLLEVKALNGKPTDIKDILATSVANNICIMALGKRFEYRDPTFLKIKHLMDEFITTVNTVSATNFFPWLNYIPGIEHLIRQAKIEHIFNEIHVYLKIIVEEHREKFINGQRDHYVNAYLTEQQSKIEKNNDVGNFNDLALINNMRILMGAGTETVTSTLLWGIIYMMLHPDIQKKVQDELDEIIGPSRTPSWNDRLRTPYTEATICEIQRKASLVPMSFPHRNTEECHVLGYKIPKNALIIPNLGNALSDPKLWGDPENFRPERFLSESGEVEKPEYFIPFSTGKRECLGEILARMELYLYFTTIMQNLTFKMSDGFKPSLKSVSVTNIPPNFITCAILRHHL